MSKVVRVSEGTYKRLEAYRRDGESFADAVARLVEEVAATRAEPGR